jgi:hypothetical protein
MSTATQSTAAPAASEAATSPLAAAIAQTDHRANIEERAANFLGVSKENVCDLLRNCWKTSEGKPPLTKQEMFSGLSMIARYQLDPIAREVYVTRDNKGRLMTIIGIDGIIKVLDRTDHFDGFTQDYEFNEKTGEMEWCETRIHSKKRTHPTTYRAYAKEYAKLGGFMAKQIPWHMLRLFSLRHATRMFTPLGGVVTEEEAQWMSQASDPGEAAPPSSLDDLADRLTQPAKQQTEPVDNHCAEPEPKETPQTDASQAADRASGHRRASTWTDAELSMIHDCDTMLSSVALDGDVPAQYEAIEKSCLDAMAKCDASDALVARVTEMIAERRAKVMGPTRGRKTTKGA